MELAQATPVLQVADVGRSIAWYREHLGFQADPFPASPPYRFAILRQGPVEVMLRLGSASAREARKPYAWDVYLRIQGESIRAVFERLESRGVVSRRLERMAYGLAEFEVTDPDGHSLCLSQELSDAGDLPSPAV